MLQLPVGAGKTIIAAAIIRMALALGNRVTFVVDALSLIDQTVRKFYDEGIAGIGVIQADHAMTDYAKPVQVASIQTLQRRGLPETDLVIVDEAHTQYRWLNELMASDEWVDIPFIGLSATPWSKGLGNHWGELIAPTGMGDLIEAGYLCPFRIFAPSHPDLSNVKTVAGDYHEGQLSEVMGEETLVADVVQTWQRLGENRPTICFAVDRAHAKKLQARFEQAGIGCGYIDAYTPAEERDAIRQKLEGGELSVVTNVGCLIKGVDWEIGCIILAAPTRSEMKFVQSIGRGLRVNPDVAPECIILDHTDNTLRLGLPDTIHKPEMCTAQKGERTVRPKSKLPKECSKCSYMKPTGVHECPSCGFKPERISDIEEGDGVLREVGKPKASKADKQLFYSGLLHIQQSKRYQDGWTSHKYREKFGVWPKGLSRVTTEPTEEVRNFVLSRQISYAKSKERHAA